MTSLAQFAYYVLDFYKWIVIIAVVLSWLVNFEVINLRNQLAASIVRMFYAMTEPVFRPIRQFLPDLGGLDLSPLIVFFGILFLQIIIINNFL